MIKRLIWKLRRTSPMLKQWIDGPDESSVQVARRGDQVVLIVRAAKHHPLELAFDAQQAKRTGAALRRMARRITG